MKRFQNKIAQSSFTLPTMAIIAIVVSVVFALIGIVNWASIPLMALSTLVMLEFNNRNLLLRIRSRMVSTTFLVLTMMCGYSLSSPDVATVQLCVAMALFFIAQTYLDSGAVGVVFYAFACLGIASIFFQPVLWLCILFLVFMTSPLYSFCLRTLSASVLGLLLPYLFYIPYYIYATDQIPDAGFFTSLYDKSVLLDYSAVTIGMIVNFASLLILCVLGTFHFLHKSYQDKIQTRMYYDLFIAFSWVMLILIPIVPRFASQLIPLACIPIAPLVAHYITLTSTKLTNISFVVMLVVSLLIFIFNQCLTSLSSMVL